MPPLPDALFNMVLQISLLSSPLLLIIITWFRIIIVFRIEHFMLLSTETSLQIQDFFLINSEKMNIIDMKDPKQNATVLFNMDNIKLD